MVSGMTSAEPTIEFQSLKRDRGNSHRCASVIRGAVRILFQSLKRDRGNSHDLPRPARRPEIDCFNRSNAIEVIPTKLAFLQGT